LRTICENIYIQRVLGIQRHKERGEIWLNL
jgi:hypothetical protein